MNKEDRKHQIIDSIIEEIPTKAKKKAAIYNI